MQFVNATSVSCPEQTFSNKESANKFRFFEELDGSSFLRNESSALKRYAKDFFIFELRNPCIETI
ncbi:hypothetical protein DLM78_20150 [Leptospira stimsonii]|uniref:Uncharacterized protein n=1 Tax=Leptospira stimsonii TaxID=2202203 RepID=A0A8B3CMG8_9LEPT|nr:hypothetical protein DLM78_20150 [Leptospira stimsonii]